MKVAWVGSFVPGFSRNRRLAEYMELASLDVSRVTVDLWPADRVGAFETGRIGLMLKAVVVLPFLFLKLLLAPAPDVYLVSYPGWFDVPVVKLAALLKQRPVVFDIFISLYDTAVSDRRLVAEDSLVGRAAKVIDRFSLRAADIVIADSPAHARFFESLAHLDQGSVHVLYLSADEALFGPVDGIETDPNLVFFYGTYVPLQGAEWIVRAAHCLGRQASSARFVMLGSGQDRMRTEDLAAELGCDNVEFRDAMDQVGLVDEMHKAAIVLGVFGMSDKADRVIPHKVFEAVACGRTVLTGATTAVREGFSEDEVATCRLGDGDDLARALVALLENADRRRRLGENARRAFVERYGSWPQVERLMHVMESACGGAST